MSEQEQAEQHRTWMGHCERCGGNWEVEDRMLVEQFPDFAAVAHEVYEDGIFETDCPSCGARISLEALTIKMIPFSHWSILPPAEGLCQECGHPHEPELPHNRDSLMYQYKFRQDEGKAGRTERWPTWIDAMAHCTPDVKAGWSHALAERGVDLE